MVEPTGPIEDDPNLTDKKYPGNPTKSYRSRNPLRVIGEVTDWQGHSPEELSDLSDLVLRQSRTESGFYSPARGKIDGVSSGSPG
jgi:hypothetical protein